MNNYSDLNSETEGRTPRPPKNVSTTRSNQLLAQARESTIFSDRYCCFAIPLYNAGVYSILAQFTVCGFTLGVLSFFAPSILAIAIEPNLTVFFGVLCLLVGLLQGVGFYAVYKEKPVIFKKYFMVNSGLLIITLSYSLILLIISSTKHETAIVQCLVQFVSNDEFLDGPSDTSREVCSIWTYIQLAICFFLWILFFFSELYFCHMLKVWGKEQTLDHIKYKSIISAVRQSMAASSHHPGLLDEEQDWESHSRVGSLDSPRGSRYSSNHARNGSGSLINGGSRLKNEIEWKELGLTTNHQTDLGLSEKDDKLSRKGKLKETEIDEEIIELADSSVAKSGSYPSVSSTNRQQQQQRYQQEPVVRNRMEPVNLHDPPKLSSSHQPPNSESINGYQNPFNPSHLDYKNSPSSSSPPINTSPKPPHPQQEFIHNDDNQIYYKSSKPT